MDKVIKPPPHNIIHHHQNLLEVIMVIERNIKVVQILGFYQPGVCVNSHLCS
jgi:hypothetical protein